MKLNKLALAVSVALTAISMSPSAFADWPTKVDTGVEIVPLTNPTDGAGGTTKVDGTMSSTTIVTPGVAEVLAADAVAAVPAVYDPVTGALITPAVAGKAAVVAAAAVPAVYGGQPLTNGLTEGGTDWASGNKTLTFTTKTWTAPVLDNSRAAAVYSAASNSEATTVKTVAGTANGVAKATTVVVPVGYAIPIFSTYQDSDKTSSITAINAAANTTYAIGYNASAAKDLGFTLTAGQAAGTDLLTSSQITALALPANAAAANAALAAGTYSMKASTNTALYDAAYKASIALAVDPAAPTTAEKLAAQKSGIDSYMGATGIYKAAYDLKLATAVIPGSPTAAEIAAAQKAGNDSLKAVGIVGYSNGKTLTAAQIAAGQKVGEAVMTVGAAGLTPAVGARFKAGLAGTNHDFTLANNGTTRLGGNANKKQVGLCTFCHTPHKASATILLWNHTMSKNSFSWDVTATTAGTNLPGFSGSTYNGPSAKCLSCHDGSVAIGDVGWFGQGANVSEGTNGRTNNGVLNAYMIGSNNTITGAANKDTKVVGKGGNLSGTHPVAIPYPLNGAPNVYNSSTTGARLATGDWVADPTASSNIRLYTDTGGGAIVGKVTAGKTGMECSSCHDVHNKASVDTLFLRGKIAGSSQSDGYICMQCHLK